MGQRKLILFLGLAVLLLGATGFSSLPIVSAHGNVDQKNDGPGFFGGGVAISPTAQPLGQEFTPKLNNLIGVDIWLSQIKAGTRDITVTIWQGSINTGTSLGSSTRTITSDISGLAGITDFHFDFVPTIPLIPGQLYTMQVEDPATEFIFGLSPVGGTDPYPGGDAITFGTPENFDFAFRTYFLSSDVGGKLILPGEQLKAITLRVERVDIVHTDDQAVKRVITVLDFESPITFNLLSLQSGILTNLGICDDIPDGVVTQIRLVVIGASITFNGKTFELVIPGGEVKLNGVLTVSNNEDAVFEFDAEKSLIPMRDGVFKLKPVLEFGTTNTDC